MLKILQAPTAEELAEIAQRRRERQLHALMEQLRARRAAEMKSR
jgi:hypothetical protein